MGAAGKRPQSTHPLYQSKYHCYMTYFKIFSLGVWKTCLCSTRSCREARYLFCPFFRLLSIEGPANLCDSVATECLPAAECSALLQPSPPPLSPSLLFHCSLPPCGSYRLAFLLLIFPRASRPRAALSELAHLY